MEKLNLNTDISYCNGATLKGQCIKQDHCKRYLKHYKVDAQCLWFVSADECIRNNHLHFLEFSNKVNKNVLYGYDKLNEAIARQ